MENEQKILSWMYVSSEVFPLLSPIIKSLAFLA